MMHFFPSSLNAVFNTNNNWDRRNEVGVEVILYKQVFCKSLYNTSNLYISLKAKYSYPTVRLTHSHMRLPPREVCLEELSSANSSFRG